MADYRIPRGDDRVIVHTFSGLGVTGLTGCTVWWTLKSSHSRPDADADINHWWDETDEFGLSLTDPDEPNPVADIEDAILYNHITRAETLALSPGRTYHYDLQLMDRDGHIDTLDEGTLRITLDVTERATLTP
jgi:hypothetical protein